MNSMGLGNLGSIFKVMYRVDSENLRFTFPAQMAICMPDSSGSWKPLRRLPFWLRLPSCFPLAGDRWGPSLWGLLNALEVA